MSNELYVIHLNGEILEPDIWKKYSNHYGSAGLYGWRAPKKIYYTLGRARAALKHLPDQVQLDCEIVRYSPAEVVERGADTFVSREEKERRKQEKLRKAAEAEHKRRIEYHEKELANLRRKA